MTFLEQGQHRRPFLKWRYVVGPDGCNNTCWWWQAKIQSNQSCGQGSERFWGEIMRPLSFADQINGGRQEKVGATVSPFWNNLSHTCTHRRTHTHAEAHTRTLLSFCVSSWHLWGSASPLKHLWFWYTTTVLTQLIVIGTAYEIHFIALRRKNGVPSVREGFPAWF